MYILGVEESQSSHLLTYAELILACPSPKKAGVPIWTGAQLMLRLRNLVNMAELLQ